VTQTATKQQPETAPQQVVGEVLLTEMPVEDSREWQAQRLRLFWKRRLFYPQVGALGLVASTLVALLIPKSFTSTGLLMPPDAQSSSNLALLAAMAPTKGARP
jgi:hypothetical protein